MTMKNGKGAKLMIKIKRIRKRDERDDEGAKVMMKNDEGAKLMMKNDEGVKLMMKNRKEQKW